MAKEKTEYNQKEINELQKILEEKEKDFFEARQSLAQRKLKDVHTLSKIRHEIARVKTALARKKMGV